VGEQTWSEFEIIDRFFSTIQGHLPGEVIAGIGDDAAILTPDKDAPLLVTHDMMVEDVHFRGTWMPPDTLARKLVKVNISDIAAMGGIPQFGILSLALPDFMEKGWLEAFSDGLKGVFQEYNLFLIGGDTSRSPGPVVVALTLLGKGGNGFPVLRHHPKAGETLFVTGTLGDSSLGMKILNRKGTNSLTEDEAYLVKRHLDPTPRVSAGREIASRHLASTMIDISDGLIADLGHLLEGTSLGAEIQVESLPLSQEFKRVASKLNDTPETLALAGGEDYELLFTSSISPDAFTLSSPTPKITPIGHITETPGIRVLKHGTPLTLETGGFQHRFHQKG